jgi:hypothetical protein
METMESAEFCQTQANRNGNKLRELSIITHDSDVFGNMDYAWVMSSMLIGSGGMDLYQSQLQ